MAKRIKVVLDTNVLISAFIANINSSPRIIFDFFCMEKLMVVTSKELLNELSRSLHYPKIKKIYKLSNRSIIQYLQFLQQTTHRVIIKNFPQIIKTDPDDNLILACALAGKADFIVSGDKHLLRLKKYRGIKIVAPLEFVQLLQ